MEYLIHIANVLYVLSYSVRDILWLRLLTVVALVALIPYYYTRSPPLYEAIYWNLLFLVINVFQLWRLLLERRPVVLTPEQRQLHRLAFASLRPRAFLKLLSLGQWETVAGGQELVRAGEPLERLSVISEGNARVEVDGRPVTDLCEGQFVGELSYVTGQPPRARVVATTSCRCVHWRHAPLRKFLDRVAEVRTALQDIIGADLARKLRRDGEGNRSPA